MEATQVIHTNGDVENTITLNPEESTAVLDRLHPNIAAAITEQLSQPEESILAQPTSYSQLSSEEFERILDEAVGIPPQNTMENMFPVDTTTSQEETNDIIHEDVDVVRPVEYTDISDSSDNPVSAVQESPAPVEFNQLNTNFTSDVTSRIRRS